MTELDEIPNLPEGTPREPVSARRTGGRPGVTGAR